MGNIIKKLWREIKNYGENIGLCLFIIGILVLLTLLVLYFIGILREEWPFGVFIGLVSVGFGLIAIGMAEKTDKWARARLTYLQGTVEEASSAELDLARIHQSKTLTGVGIEDTIYDSNKYNKQGVPFYFGNAWIDLDSMKEGDVVVIRIYVTEGSSEKVYDEETFSGTHTRMVKIGGNFHNRDGVKITATQMVAGSSPIKIDCYVYDAIRGG